MDVLGVILAGGNSTRMGRDKALTELAGRPLVEWVATALASVASEMIVVGRAGHLAGFECVPDDQPARRGPLAGVATALRLSEGRPVAVTAVDQPWVRVETLTRLVELAGPLHAVVPLDGGARQVTCALYPAAWAEQANTENARGGTIQSLLDRLLFRPVEENEWTCWGEDGRSWFSVDSPEALKDGLSRFGPPPT